MDWQQVFFGEEDKAFFLEIFFRTFVMFILVVATLHFTGKRGVRQLSVFEMVMIIALGSAAGDPMFYKEVGILHALAVFIIVLLTYRLLIWLITKFDKLETILEGEPIYVIKNGKFTVKSTKNNDFGSDEFFAELRVKNIDHLGQVRCAVLETNGEISISYYADEEVKPGLPVWPEEYNKRSMTISEKGLYACSHCGQIEIIEPAAEYACEQCKNKFWVKPLECIRIC